MATVKIILRKEQKKDGTFPLAIRITKDRKSSHIYLEYSLRAEDWDSGKQRVKKSHSNSTRLNNYLITKLAEATDKSLELETQKAVVSSKAVKQKIKPIGGKSFFAQADVFIENLRKSGKYNRVVSEVPRLKIFRGFLDDKDVTFEEITIPLLNRFRAYLKGGRKVKERTVMNYMILIRTIFNQAITAKITDINHYPFGKGKISIKFPESVKIGLTIDEVRTIELMDLSDESFLNHARNVWLFSFYFAGVRACDVLSLKRQDFQNNRLYYSMNKNGKADSLNLSSKATKILAQYRDMETKHDLVFPELSVVDDFGDLYEVQRKASYAIKRLDQALKKIAEKAGIEKPLTMHISRHTFGNISGDKIPLQMLQKLYRHSSITTTISYQANFVHKDADDALAAVIGR